VNDPASGFAVLRKALATWVMPQGGMDTEESVASVSKGTAVGGLWFWPGAEAAFDSEHKQDSPATRTASVHVQGLQYVEAPHTNDGANVGRNSSSLVAPGGSHTDVFYAGEEGAFFRVELWHGGTLQAPQRP
jgi:manganese oxidase